MIQEQMFPDKTAQNKSVKLITENRMLCQSCWFTDRTGREDHRSVRTDGGFKEQAQTEASKQLVTSDLHCKNGSILLYRHIFSKVTCERKWNQLF